MESKPKHRPATPSQPAPDIDRNAVDPKAILASIASDPEMPPMCASAPLVRCSPRPIHRKARTIARTT
jgi:hypothetical protein